MVHIFDSHHEHDDVCMHGLNGSVYVGVCMCGLYGSVYVHVWVYGSLYVHVWAYGSVYVCPMPVKTGHLWTRNTPPCDISHY